MSSENRPGSFLFVPDVKSAEKVLHEHELDTTTSFVMYYNNGLGKGTLNVRSAYSVALLIIGLCTPKWNIWVQNIARGTEEPFFLGGGGKGGTNKKKFLAIL